MPRHRNRDPDRKPASSFPSSSSSSFPFSPRHPLSGRGGARTASEGAEQRHRLRSDDPASPHLPLLREKEQSSLDPPVEEHCSSSSSFIASSLPLVQLCMSEHGRLDKKGEGRSLHGLAGRSRQRRQRQRRSTTRAQAPCHTAFLRRSNHRLWCWPRPACSRQSPTDVAQLSRPYIHGCDAGPRQAPSRPPTPRGEGRRSLLLAAPAWSPMATTRDLESAAVVVAALTWHSHTIAYAPPCLTSWQPNAVCLQEPVPGSPGGVLPSSPLQLEEN